uniref:Uncharacterized protein n=1 Tax=Arundo donax TaxID=35708 RepID=A0A0A8YXG5_ARUDO
MIELLVSCTRLYCSNLYDQECTRKFQI